MSTVVPGPGNPHPPAPGRSRWALPVLLSAVLVTTLDFFVVNAALPAIERDLDAGAGALRMVVAGYGLAYAAGLITAARLGELYGQRRVFLVGVALFTAASAGCGLAADAAWLVGFRVAQGGAAALMAPQVLVLIGVLYPAGAERARAFGRYGATVGLAGVSGQVVGGLLIAADPVGLGWRACFLVNLPLGVAALVSTPRSVPAPGPAVRSRGALDPVGALLIAVGLGCAAWALLRGGAVSGQLPCILGAIGAAVVLARQQRGRVRAGRRPLVDPTVFRQRGFPAGVAALGLLFGTSAALSTILPLYLQLGCGYGPLASGAVAASINVGFLGAAAGTGRCCGRFGDRLPTAGALLLAAGIGAAGCATATGTVAVLSMGLLVAGAGMGLVLAPLTSAVLVGVGPGRVAAASGVIGTAQEMGGVLGGASATSVFFALLGDERADARWEIAFRGSVGVLVLFGLGVAVLAALHRRRGAAGSRTVAVTGRVPTATRTESSGP
ncbi:MFS transporter [Embleya scabrispora]|uniref:MFS transporter n=1 Tax=Embleya scabrispora TaxID=159449 RepID=UPI0013751679|nr:MFS transporter [Embleya scabrispora]